MRPALRRDLRYSGVLDAEFFAQQGTRFVEPIVFRRESHPCIDTIGVTDRSKTSLPDRSSVC